MMQCRDPAATAEEGQSAKERRRDLGLIKSEGDEHGDKAVDDSGGIRRKLYQREF